MDEIAEEAHRPPLLRVMDPAKFTCAAVGAAAASWVGRCSNWPAFAFQQTAGRRAMAVPQMGPPGPTASAHLPPGALGRQSGAAPQRCFLAGATVLACASASATRRSVGSRRGAAPAVQRRARGGEDFYETLGVSRSANEREIKSSFRRLARQYHPDVNKEEGAQDKFQKIARAYEVLSDSDKRARYDQFGEAGVQGMGAGPDMSSINLEDILGDVFGSFFNMGGGPGGMRGGFGGMGGQQRRGAPRGPQKGADLQCEVVFPFEIACFGGDRTVQVRREEQCETCEGSGLKPGTSANAQKCRTCNGTGVTVQVMQTPLGVMQTQQVCPSCNGSGIDPSAVCESCRGKGTKPALKEVSVKVPAGCADGNQLRVRGEGDKGTKGGPAGDLYIQVKVEPSEEFSREGFDIYTERSIDVYDAILGTSVVVKTIDGDTEIKVPAGTQPETKMRIRGRGVPKLGKPGERGDHYITMKVQVPRKLSSKQKNKLMELKELAE